MLNTKVCLPLGLLTEARKSLALEPSPSRETSSNRSRLSLVFLVRAHISLSDALWTQSHVLKGYTWMAYLHRAGLFVEAVGTPWQDARLGQQITRWISSPGRAFGWMPFCRTQNARHIHQAAPLLINVGVYLQMCFFGAW